MAEDSRGRGLPPPDHQEESHYPPPPGEEDDRPRSYHLPAPPMSSGVTLPSISDHAYGHRYPPPPDSRQEARSRGDYSASPTNANGYGPPAGPYLPPVQVGPDPRAGYGGDTRDYYGGPQRHAYAQEQYSPYNGYRGGPAPPPPAGYPPYQVDFRSQPAHQQAAPRQRTSIACRYCRKRKIRCSGYQNTPDGKCTNCKKTGNECVFQPVSSSASTAFIPVSAVPGGVPPGTPLYGAFGQPLAPASGGGVPPQAAYAPAPTADYPLPSPTGSAYYPHPDDRAQAGQRRTRPLDDEPGMRLPPPEPSYRDEDPRDPRRRSPASMQSNTPPTAYQYARSAEYEIEQRTTPTARRDSPSGGSAASGSQGIMALGHLMEGPPPRSNSDSNNIDRNMLGRLDRRS